MQLKLIIYKLILLTVFCVMQADIYGQTNVLGQRVSVKGENVHATDFILQIESAYQVKFYYPPNIFTEGSKKSYDYNDISLEDAIKKYFWGLNYFVFVQDNQIYILKGRSVSANFLKDFYGNYTMAGQSKLMIDIEQQSALDQDVNVEYELLKFGAPSSAKGKQTYTLKGKIIDLKTGEPLPWVAVQVKGTNIGAVSDLNGDFQISAKGGRHEVVFQAIGKSTTRRQIALYGNGEIEVPMQDQLTGIEEVVVLGKYENKVGNMLIGMEKIDRKQIKKMPMIMGEADVIKGLLAMPGVQTASEASNGFNVRGGNADQNLVLLNEVPIMNTSHFFGFFTSFNADIVNEAVLYKGGFPANLGGRASSILEISSQTGDMEKFSLEGGVSPVTTKFTLQGPIIKNKVSLLLSGRTTYSDWMLAEMTDERVRNSSASFYDLFGNLYFDINDKNKITITGYRSYDYFDFSKVSRYEYENQAYSIKYNSFLTTRLKNEFSAGYSSYWFNLSDIINPVYASSSEYAINQYKLKNVFRIKTEKNWLDLKVGVSATYYENMPGEKKPFNEESYVAYTKMNDEKGLEASVFAHNDHVMTSWLSFSYGLRYSMYTSFGPKEVINYADGASKDDLTIQSSSEVAAGEIEKFYGTPEFRFLAKFTTGATSSVKLNYSRMAQYISMLSNTVTSTPTDIWKLADTYFKPQISDQLSLGYFRDVYFSNNTRANLSAEAYVKHTQNVVDYKVGAQLFGKEHLETEVINGINDSYGIELQVSKNSGKVNGWVNYVYSRSLNKFDNKYLIETLNNGNYIPSNFDRPHSFKLFMNYDMFRRLRFSCIMNYSTGNPLTLPEAEASYFGENVLIYSERNMHRAPDYFRLDLAATIEGNLKKDKFLHGSVTFSLVNATGRKNPYSIIFMREFGKLKAYALSIYGVPIPALTYNFKIK